MNTLQMSILHRTGLGVVKNAGICGMVQLVTLVHFYMEPLHKHMMPLSLNGTVREV